MHEGADDYLTKPLDLDELRARLIAAERVTSLHRRLAEQATALERSNQALFEIARTDPLTGLGNRLLMSETLEDAPGPGRAATATRTPSPSATSTASRRTTTSWATSKATTPSAPSRRS